MPPYANHILKSYLDFRESNDDFVRPKGPWNGHCWNNVRAFHQRKESDIKKERKAFVKTAEENGESENWWKISTLRPRKWLSSLFRYQKGKKLKETESLKQIRRIMYNLVSCYDSMELRDRGDITSDKVSKNMTFLAIQSYIDIGDTTADKVLKNMTFFNNSIIYRHRGHYIWQGIEEF